MIPSTSFGALSGACIRLLDGGKKAVTYRPRRKNHRTPRHCRQRRSNGIRGIPATLPAPAVCFSRAIPSVWRKNLLWRLPCERPGRRTWWAGIPNSDALRRNCKRSCPGFTRQLEKVRVKLEKQLSRHAGHGVYTVEDGQALHAPDAHTASAPPAPLFRIAVEHGLRKGLITTRGSHFSASKPEDIERALLFL